MSLERRIKERSDDLILKQERVAERQRMVAPIQPDMMKSKEPPISALYSNSIDRDNGYLALNELCSPADPLDITTPLRSISPAEIDQWNCDIPQWSSDIEQLVKPWVDLVRFRFEGQRLVVVYNHYNYK